MPRVRNVLKGLSLDRLETLSAIVVHGGIMRAAGGDANRQSQFSRQVAELEAWFGVELLDRSVTPSRPTEAALRISRQVDAFRKEMDEVREAAGKGRRTVVFGAGERMIRSYLIPWATKLGKNHFKLVFRNMTSSQARAGLLARRLDIAILRAVDRPEDMEFFALKPIPLLLALPENVASGRKRWEWKHLAEISLILPEGDGRCSRFLRDRALEAGCALDVAMECSSWTQTMAAMHACRLGAFIPKDLEKELPSGFSTVPLPALSAYSDEYVVAWNRAKRRDPEMARLLGKLRGK